MKNVRKNISWIFSGVGVALLVAAYNIASDDMEAIAGDSARYEQNIGNVRGGRDITIIQSQQRDADSIGESLESDDLFIGALDGKYTKKTNGYIIVEAKWDRQEVAFIAGNCLFNCALIQSAGSWDLYVKDTDGLCNFLRQLKVGDKIARIIPTPGAMANSGRVLEFYTQSGDFAIDEFDGKYTDDY